MLLKFKVQSGDPLRKHVVYEARYDTSHNTIDCTCSGFGWCKPLPCIHLSQLMDSGQIPDWKVLNEIRRKKSQAFLAEQERLRKEAREYLIHGKEARQNRTS